MSSPHSVVAICLVWLIAISPSLAAAQPDSFNGTPFSVRAIFDSALVLNSEAQSQSKRIEALIAKKEATGTLTAQPLALESSYRSDRNNNNQGLREIELGVSTTLWNWNERNRTQALRDSELNTIQAQFEATKLELAAEIRPLIWDTLSAHLDLEIAQIRVETSKKLTDDIARRVEAGELAKTDLYQAQALHTQTKLEVEKIRLTLSDIGSEFSSITGLPVSVLKNTSPENVNFSEDLHALEHPSLKLAQAQLQTINQQAELLLSQKRANPEVALSVISERAAFSMGTEKSWILSTRIPFGNSSGYQSRVLETQANQLAAQASLKKTERSVVAKSRSAGNGVKVFQQLCKTTFEQAELAQKIHALYQESFEVGETDLPTLLRYEQQAFEAKRLAKKSDIEYAAKVSAYRQALGLLPE